MLAPRRAGLMRFLLPFALVLLLAACGGPQPEAGRPLERPADTTIGAGSSQPRAGGSITVAAASDAVSFHPYKTSDSGSTAYQALVYAGGLVTRDPHSPDTFVGELAESWALADDRVTYTFHLRPNLRWSDGHPITSADFKWTFEQARLPENNYPYAVNFEPIVSFETPDPQTIVVTLKEPSAVGLDSADAVRPLPKHIWERLDWNDANRNPEIQGPTVASGPFKLKEWQRDSHATIVANELYFKGRPLLDSYSVQIVGNQQIAFEKLRAGEVDRAGFDPAN